FDRSELITRIRGLAPPTREHGSTRARSGIDTAKLDSGERGIGGRLHLTRTDMFEFLSLW
ncbi:MAG: hypothetical protein QF521_11430, partial [Alphaproteobacteria bacterium]|nr:hypothetical protein [Alphaproteobacteria bacterium]